MSDPATSADALVALATVVESAVLPKKSCPPCTKPVPVAASVKAPDPAVADDGWSDASVGTGLSAPTVTLMLVALKPPPGGGVNASIASVPGADRYDAGIVPWSSVDEM